MTCNNLKMVGTGFYMVGASIFALAACPNVAMAQEAPDGGLDEIVVTAQKTEQNLQDIPVAVTALNAGAIENLQVRNIGNLSGLSPNLTIAQSVSGSDPIITLRGIIGSNVTNGSDSAVAMYVDGVYVARTTGSSFDVADLERVEILRGPQGTLYGKNSTGGAINLITSAPKGEFYARLEGSIGNLDSRRVKVRVDTPKIGAFSLSASYLHDEREGYVRNIGAGNVWNFSAPTNGTVAGNRVSANTLGDRKADAGFVAVRFAPDGSDVTVDYKFDMSKITRTNLAQQILFDGSGAIPTSQVSFKPLAAVNMPFTTPEKLDVFGHSLTVNVKVSDSVTFKSITGYRGSTDIYTNDVAGGSFPDTPIPNVGTFHFFLTSIAAYERSRQFSQELQFNYASKAIDLVGGAFYFNEKTRSTGAVYIFQGFVGGIAPAAVIDSVGPIGANASNPGIYGDVTSRNDSIAGYVQGTLHATDQFDITGGIRHTKDSRAADESGFFFGTARKDFSKDFSHTDWTANVTFRPNKNLTLYAKAGSGYLSGGVFAGFAFEPETVIQYEAGVKADLLDRHLRINVAGFHTDYKGLQVANFYVPAGTSTALYYIQNVASAKINGLEVEVTAKPVDNLTLNASYGYTDFKYNTPGLQRSYQPKHTVSLNGNYMFPEFGGGIKPSFDINARYKSNELLLASATSPALDAFLNKNASWLVDTRFTLAGISLGGSKAKLSVWAKNIFNDRTIANATNATGGFIVNGQFQEPRTYGIDLGFEF